MDGEGVAVVEVVSVEGVAFEKDGGGRLSVVACRRSPEGVGLDDGEATVAPGEWVKGTAGLRVAVGDGAVPYQRWPEADGAEARGVGEAQPAHTTVRRGRLTMRA